MNILSGRVVYTATASIMWAIKYGHNITFQLRAWTIVIDVYKNILLMSTI